MPDGPAAMPDGPAAMSRTSSKSKRPSTSCTDRRPPSRVEMVNSGGGGANPGRGGGRRRTSSSDPSAPSDSNSRCSLSASDNATTGSNRDASRRSPNLRSAPTSTRWSGSAVMMSKGRASTASVIGRRTRSPAAPAGSRRRTPSRATAQVASKADAAAVTTSIAKRRSTSSSGTIDGWPSASATFRSPSTRALAPSSLARTLNRHSA